MATLIESIMLCTPTSSTLLNAWRQYRLMLLCSKSIRRKKLCNCFIHTTPLYFVQYWFNIFAPHRLEVDLEHHYSNHQPQQLQQRSEVEANATGGTVEIGLNVVDVGKILQTKPLREKRLVYYQLEPPMTLSKVYHKKKTSV